MEFTKLGFEARFSNVSLRQTPALNYVMSGAYNPNSITAANGGVAAKARWNFVKGAVKDGLVTTGKVSVRECVSARRAATASATEG